MKLMIIGDKKFNKELINLKNNIKKQKIYLPTFNLGGLDNEKTIDFFKKDLEKIKEIDALLICNFDKDREINYIDDYSIMLLSISKYLNKKVYLLYELPDNKQNLKSYIDKEFYGNLKEIEKL